MTDDTRAVTLAVDTPEQRDDLLAVCEEILEAEVGSLPESGEGADLALVQTAIDDAEALGERLNADGSLCLVPGCLVDPLYECLRDLLDECLADAGPASIADRQCGEDRVAHLQRAGGLLVMMTALAV